MEARTELQIERAPAPLLRRSVTSYVGFDIAGFPPGIHLGTPGRALNLVVSLDEPLEVVDPAGSAPPRRFDAAVGGLMESSVAIRHEGRQHGIRLSLTPAGARALFGLPSAALAGELLHLDELIGPTAAELVDRLRSSQGWAQRFRVLDEVLTSVVARPLAPSRARRVDAIRAEVDAAWRHLVMRRGQVRIDGLAADLGWSRRHLGHHFRAEIGLAPKTAARVLRFEHAHELAANLEQPPWAEIAATAGYADQAHLVRDWRAFTGRPPTVWRREEVLPE